MATLISVVLTIVITALFLGGVFRIAELLESDLEKLLESEESSLFKYLLIVILIGWLAVTIFAIYPLQLENVYTSLESFLGPISEFFFNLFNTDDKVKFLFQNDIEIIKFIFLVIIFTISGLFSLAVFCLAYCILIVLTAYLLYLPCRYFYLLLLGDRSIIRNARAESEIFKFFEFLIYGFLALIVLITYLKIKESYLGK